MKEGLASKSSCCSGSLPGVYVGSRTSLHSCNLATMNRLLLKPSKYLSSFREGYAAIFLLIPFLNPMSSNAAVEYPVGLDDAMGPEGTGLGLESSRSSSLLEFVQTIHQMRRDEMDQPEGQFQSCRTQLYVSYRL